jgi:hypothetical protein
MGKLSVMEVGESPHSLICWTVYWMRGGAVQVQVDPIKLTLKPFGTKRLELKCDELVSSFAFKFNLRRCSAG